MKRCRLCPYRKHCRDVCYGDAPCDFARAFDSLDRKLKWWQAKAKATEAAAKPTPEPLIFGDYAFLPGQKCVQQQDELVDQQEGLRGGAVLLHSKHGCGGGAPASERGQLYRNV